MVTSYAAIKRLCATEMRDPLCGLDRFAQRQGLESRWWDFDLGFGKKKERPA